MVVPIWPYKWPTSWAATIIPLKPPVSSIIATLLTFSNLLFTTQAPPTYANPRVNKKWIIDLEINVFKVSFKHYIQYMLSVENWAWKK